MKLEKYLILNKYLLSLFGVHSISDLREELKNKSEGFDNDGKSFFADTLIGLKNLKINRYYLIQYDLAIKEYSERLSKYRRENIVLKHFQYLAVLFTEIYLDKYFNRKEDLLSDLNYFLEGYNQSEKTEISFFEDKDLKKLAYWMATGSGKTLIMHINYWQFLKYNTQALDNIIMVTPNEGLSKQHYNEMQRSDIPCRLYSENIYNSIHFKDEVLIIDIHKLTEEKKGAGIRVETSYFEGRNLVFIDEGHKGQKTEEQKWKKLREDLGKYGFLFEYSATFGQVIDEKNHELLEEYSKAILFDYSYKYFYEDGYGKDFYVYNLKKDSFTGNYKDIILSANLLSFYEQLLLYKNYREELKEYLIEKPLWAFIGSTVAGKGVRSDVLEVVIFLRNVLENRDFLEENITKILNGESGLYNHFKDRFHYIRKNGYNINDIYKRLFNTNGGTLQLYELKSSDGEIGLKVGESDYFGVINIGDVARFKKILAENHFEEKTDVFTPSLFEQINKNNSNINVIIGAKKFIEGWDSWRVCSMGLINMGKSEGPQIIQLFGRGVRLKGRGLSLKRSNENKYHVKSLETLNIFGLNADYLNAFLEALTNEIEYEEIRLPIKRLDETKWKKLYTLKTDKDFDFTNHFIELEIDENLLRTINIDIRPRLRLARGLKSTQSKIEAEKVHLGKYIDLLNWNNIYYKILNYKINRGYYNLRIYKDELPEIIKNPDCKIYAFREQICPQSYLDLNNLGEIVLLVIRTYIDKFYKYKLRQAETKQMQFSFIVKDDNNLAYDQYILKIEIPKDEKERQKRKQEIEKIKNILKEVDNLYQKDIDEIPTLHFDRHLYTPLVVYDERKKFIKSEPEKLNDGETQFIRALRDYIKKNEANDCEVFLLRNLSKRGIKFFQTSGFYPDFIMWVKKNKELTMVFIDPKGIRNLGNFNDEKIQLHKTIKEIEKEIQFDNESYKPKLESLILSVSNYDDIKKTFGEGNIPKHEFEKQHILFMEDENLMDKIFKNIIR